MKRVLDFEETPNQRELWFQQCFNYLESPPNPVMAFSTRIGCGLAVGQWNHYKQNILDFANKCH